MDILSMQNVSLSFGSTRALDGLSFAVKEGEIFGFLGPSGAGKTTTIKLLTRQLRPGAGEIAVFGAPIARLDSAAYEQIGILSDNSGVYERMSVYENMKLFADLRGLPASRIGEVLEKVGLADRADAYPAQLSGGQKAKIFFLHMVLEESNVLLLDEPTRNFSPLSGPVIRETLSAFGGAILSVSHDRLYLEEVCQTIYALTPQGLERVWHK